MDKPMHRFGKLRRKNCKVTKRSGIESGVIYRRNFQTTEVNFYIGDW